MLEKLKRLDNINMVIVTACIGLAIASWSVVSLLLLCFAGHHFIHYLNDQKRNRHYMLTDTLFEVAHLHVECIEVLANKLIPHIGHEEVLKILDKHKVEYEGAWRKYTDKYPPKPPKPPKQKQEALELSKNERCC